MTTLYYVLQVVGDVDPVLHGPYKTNAGRDRKAKRLRKECNEDLKDGLYPLDWHGKTFDNLALPKLSVSTYSGGFFEEE